MKNKNSFKRTNPADAANLFVRNLLCDLSEEFGGFSEKEWKRTLKFFDHRCAYTGEKLTQKKTVIDHLIAHNRQECGLHLYGNLIPATKEANAAKSSSSFEDFINNNTSILGDIDAETRKGRIEKIRQFQQESGYSDVLKKIKSSFNLQDYVNDQYDCIINKAKENKEKLHTKLEAVETDGIASTNVLLQKISTWSKKPSLNVHKIIAIVVTNPKISTEALISIIEKLDISKNAIGTLKSLMSDAGNSYGSILEENDSTIDFCESVKSKILEYTWHIEYQKEQENVI